MPRDITRGMQGKSCHALSHLVVLLLRFCHVLPPCTSLKQLCPSCVPNMGGLQLQSWVYSARFKLASGLRPTDCPVHEQLNSRPRVHVHTRTQHMPRQEGREARCLGRWPSGTLQARGVAGRALCWRQPCLWRKQGLGSVGCAGHTVLHLQWKPQWHGVGVCRGGGLLVNRKTTLP